MSHAAISNARRHPAVEIGDAANGKCVVCHGLNRKYFRLGEREAAFLKSLDGTRSLDELRASSREGFMPEQVDRLLGWYGSNGLLAADDDADEMTPARPWHARLKDFVCGPRRWRIPLVDPDAFLSRHLRLIHALFSPAALLAYLLVLLAPVALPVPSVALLELQKQPMSGLQWTLLYLGTLCAIAVHELAHAVACKHFGGQVRSIGVRLLYLQPVAYCDVSDSWRLREKDHKIAVASAGCFVNLLIASLSWVAFMLAGRPVLLHFALVNLFLALWNLIPFVKLDGYWIAVHLLDEPHLREKSLRAPLQSIARLFHRMPVAATTGSPLSPAVLLAFGWLSMVFTIGFCCLGLWGIHRLLAWALPDLALMVSAGIATVLIGKAGRWAWMQFAAMRAERAGSLE